MRSSSPALIGLFVVGALLIGIGGLLAFGGTRWFSPSNQAVIYFDQSVGGLSAGSPVTFKGVEIGSVTGVSLQVEPETFAVLMPVHIELTPGDLVISGRPDPDNPGYIDISRLVQRGLRAKLETRSLLTGQLAVDLDFMPGTDVRLYNNGGDVPEIPAVKSAADRLKTAITEFPWQETLTSVHRAMTAIESLSVNLEQDLTGIGGAVRDTVEATHTLMQESRASVAKVSRRAEQTLSRIDALSAHGERTVAARNAELRDLLAQAKGTMEQIHRVTVQVSDLAHPQSPERDDLRRILRNLASSSATLKRFADEIENDPRSLVFGREESL